MTHDDDRLDAQDRHAIFQARDDFRGRDVARDSRDEQPADRLIKHHFHRHARVGTGQHAHDRPLTFGGFGADDRQVAHMSDGRARHEPGITRHDLRKRLVRRQRRIFRQGRAGRSVRRHRHRASDPRRSQRAQKVAARGWTAMLWIIIVRLRDVSHQAAPTMVAAACYRKYRPNPEPASGRMDRSRRTRHAGKPS